MRASQSGAQSMTHYKLIGHDPVPCNLMEWARWFGLTDRHVASDKFSADTGEEITISTVFLSLDHNFKPIGEPILFETMVFGGVFDEYQWRYCTWEEAEAGHLEVVALSRTHELLDEAGADGQRAAQLAAQVIASQVLKLERK